MNAHVLSLGAADSRRAGAAPVGLTIGAPLLAPSGAAGSAAKRPPAQVRRHGDASASLTTRRSPLALRAGSVGVDGTIEGYGSVFDTLDTYGDIVRPGAYAKSLAKHAADGTRVKMLWQHDDATPIGVWDEVREDATGLYCKGRLLLDVAAAREAHALLLAGAIDGLSIGFQALAFEYVTADTPGVRNTLAMIPDQVAQGQIRAVTEIDLWEVSVVTFQSNPASTITSVRATPAGPGDSRRAPAVAGASDDRGAVSPALLAAIARRQAVLAQYLD